MSVRRLSLFVLLVAIFGVLVGLAIRRLQSILPSGAMKLTGWTANS